MGLARTLTERSADIPDPLRPPGTSNGPAPSHRRTLGAPYAALGWGSAVCPTAPPAQPHPRRTFQRPPNSNHLNPTTGTTYHTQTRRSAVYVVIIHTDVCQGTSVLTHIVGVRKIFLTVERTARANAPNFMNKNAWRPYLLKCCIDAVLTPFSMQRRELCPNPPQKTAYAFGMM